MSLYDRIFNILREGASTGTSPTKTGARVGRSLGHLKKWAAKRASEKGESSDVDRYVSDKHKQAGRIEAKVAARQGKWAKANRQAEVDTDTEAKRQGTVSGRMTKIPGRKRRSPKEVGRDSRGSAGRRFRRESDKEEFNPKSEGSPFPRSSHRDLN